MDVLGNINPPLMYCVLIVKMTDISIVIPYVNEYPALIHTVFSIQNEFVDLPYSYEIICVENRARHAYTEKFLHYMRTLIADGRLKYAFEERPCGPIARQTGALQAKGKYLIFTDAHVQLGKNTIPLLIDLLEEKDAGMVHGCTVWSHWDAHHAGCHYELYKKHPTTGGINRNWPNLNSHFHGGYTRCRDAEGPYKVAGATLAYVAFFRDRFIKSRGYHMGCRGYPHPEGYLPLKSWMLDQECWIHPKAFHYHSLYPRNYGPQVDINIDGHQLVGNDFLIRNAMICAYTLGGDKWLDKIYNEWLKYRGAKQHVLDLIKKHALASIGEERKWILDNAVYTLDEVLIQLQLNGVKGVEILA
jgi:glycosyltransferase involved in cell wall biosynthesis